MKYERRIVNDALEQMWEEGVKTDHNACNTLTVERKFPACVYFLLCRTGAHKTHKIYYFAFCQI
jgi:hypothetical protein